MTRPVVATSLFARRLGEFLNEYSGLGAVRFVERLQAAYHVMLGNIGDYDQIGPARRWTVGGKTVTVREYVLDAGSRDFLVLYWVPVDPAEPIILLNIRIGGQNRFRWR